MYTVTVLNEQVEVISFVTNALPLVGDGLIQFVTEDDKEIVISNNLKFIMKT